MATLTYSHTNLKAQERRAIERAKGIGWLEQKTRSSDESLIPDPTARMVVRDIVLPGSARDLLLQAPTWRVFCRLVRSSIQGIFPVTCTLGGPFLPGAKGLLEELCDFGLVPLFCQSRALRFSALRFPNGDPFAGSATRGVIEFLYPSVCTVCAATTLPQRCQHMRACLAALVRALKQREEVRMYIQWFWYGSHKTNMMPDAAGNWPPHYIMDMGLPGCPPVPWYLDELRMENGGPWTESRFRSIHPMLEIHAMSPLVTLADPFRVILVDTEMPLRRNDNDNFTITDALGILYEEVNRVEMPKTNQAPHAFEQNQSGQLTLVDTREG